jgi:hypothetical protein
MRTTYKRMHQQSSASIKRYELFLVDYDAV